MDIGKVIKYISHQKNLESSRFIGRAGKRSRTPNYSLEVSFTIYTIKSIVVTPLLLRWHLWHRPIQRQFPDT